MATPKQHVPDPAFLGSLAGWFEWIQNALFTRQAPIEADFRARPDQRSIIWPDQTVTTLDIAPPPDHRRFSCHLDFCRYVASFIGPARADWLPHITVGTKAATIAFDPYKTHQASLVYQWHPSFVALDRMAQNASWLPQQTAYEFARYDLAPILGDDLAKQIAQMTWTAKGQQVTAVGNNQDRGLREFQREPEGPAWANDRIKLQIPATILATGDPATMVELTFAVQTKLDDAQTLVRIVPTKVSMDLARHSVAHQYANLLLTAAPDNCQIFRAVD